MPTCRGRWRDFVALTRTTSDAIFDACFDLYPRLFVLVATASILGVSAAAVGETRLLWLTVVIGVVCGIARRSYLFGCFLCALPLLAFGYTQWRLRAAEQRDIANLAGIPKVVFVGRILAVDHDRENRDNRKNDENDKSDREGLTRRQRMQLQVGVNEILFPPDRQYQGVVLVVSSKPRTDLACGHLVIVKGKLRRPNSAQQPYEFDYAGYLRRRGILSLLECERNHASLRRWLPGEADSHVADGQPSCTVDGLFQVSGYINAMRRGIVESHRRNLGVQLGDLLSSIVIGSRAVNPPQQLVEDFRNVGLSHLLAASGFNLTIASGSLYFLAVRVLACDWLINAIAFSAILIFCLLSGASPSVNRAAIMCTLTLLARTLYRNTHTLAIISLALLGTLLIDPLAVTDIGLQLSYCAAAGIVLISGSLQASLLACRLPKPLAEASAVILSAQLAVLPVLLYHFWQVGTMFLLANLLVAPVVAPLTVIGFASSLTACLERCSPCLEQLTWVLDLFCRWPLEFLVWVAGCFSSATANRLIIGPPALIAIVIYYGAFLLLTLALRLRRHRLLALILFCMAFWLLFWRAPLPPLTVTRFPAGTVRLTADRHAVLEGRLTPGITRYLMYMGVDIKRGLEIVPSRE